MSVDWGSLALGFCCGGAITIVVLIGLLLWWLRDYRPMGY